MPDITALLTTNQQMELKTNTGGGYVTLVQQVRREKTEPHEGKGTGIGSVLGRGTETIVSLIDSKYARL